MQGQLADFLRRLRGAPRRLAERLSDARELARVRRAVAAQQPSAARAIVIFTCLSPGGVNGPGKVQAEAFLPPFAARLAEAGVATTLAASPAELRKAMAGGPAVLVHVYREVAYRIDTPEVLADEERSAGVFNAATRGPLIADKLQTNAFLTGHGVAMPSLAPEGQVFSNLRQDSAGAVEVVDSLDRADPGRYNTSFVDTRVTHRGRSYYTTVRLICVGERIVHGYVRARNVAEGSASVHARDTPLDAPLLAALQKRLVDRLMPEYHDLAARVAAALGPGFYAHDVLVPSDGGPVQLCETGFKFNDGGYAGRLSPLAAELPCHRLMFATAAWAAHSADLFLAECERLGYLTQDRLRHGRSAPALR
jgi:hypothetical protein